MSTHLGLEKEAARRRALKLVRRGARMSMKDTFVIWEEMSRMELEELWTSGYSVSAVQNMGHEYQECPWDLYWDESDKLIQVDCLEMVIYVTYM